MKKLTYLFFALAILSTGCKQDNTDLYNQACEYEEKHEYEKAVELLTQALAINPKDIECLNNRAWDYHDLNDNVKALEDFNRMLKIDPQSTAAMYGIASIKYENLEFEEALPLFNQIIEIQGSLNTESNRSRTKHAIKAPLELVFEFKEIIEDSLGIVNEMDTLQVLLDSIDEDIL